MNTTTYYLRCQYIYADALKNVRAERLPFFKKFYILFKTQMFLEVKHMFRMWGKIWKDNHLLKDTVICNDKQDTRTHKVFDALEEICYEFDLGKPIWLDSTIAEFKRHDKARFTKDNFVEDIDFDYLEIHVIEED